VACGTGTTLTGLVAAAPPASQVLGVAALKGGDFLVDDVKQMLDIQGITAYADWRILLDYHGGGFGKTSSALLGFIRDFQNRHGAELEPIYTGKLMFAIYELIQQDYFPAGQRIVAIHTGGLQGKRK
jgi:1-aminocyclopropane-1-carboxylate deaminase